MCVYSVYGYRSSFVYSLYFGSIIAVSSLSMSVISYLSALSRTHNKQCVPCVVVLLLDCFQATFIIAFTGNTADAKTPALLERERPQLPHYCVHQNPTR